jgi:UDPglucose 6-dehydrogenase
MPQVERLIPSLIFADSPSAAAEGADAVVLATAWADFLNLDMQQIKSVMKTPVIVDARNCLPLEPVLLAGFQYYSLGRTRLAQPRAGQSDS